jgi:hypothetical protein
MLLIVIPSLLRIFLPGTFGEAAVGFFGVSGTSGDRWVGDDQNSIVCG